MCVIVYDFSYYNLEFRCQFAAIFKYTGIIIIYLCIQLINVSFQIPLHLCHKFIKPCPPKPHKPPPYTFKNSNREPHSRQRAAEQISSRESAQYLLSKISHT